MYRTIFFLILVLPAFHLRAHGTEYRVVENAAGIIALYADGTVMSDSEVKVFSPGTDKKPVITGTTGKKGEFLFIPDAPGTWTVTVNDGMGHAVTAVLTAGKGAAVSALPAGSLDRQYKLAGIFITLWALIMTAMYFRARKQ